MRNEFRDPTASDRLTVGAFMREADAAECRALGLSPYHAVNVSMRASKMASAWYLEGRCAALCGVREADVKSLRVGEVWCLTTPLVERAPVAFVKATRTWLARQQPHFDVLSQMVDVRYTKAVAWLQLVGFRQGAVSLYGPKHMPFVLMRRDSWAQ